MLQRFEHAHGKMCFCYDHPVCLLQYYPPRGAALEKNGHYGYVYGIDAIRFVSALFVAVFHLTYRNAEGVWMMPVGWIGVQIFFVISGVVIANSATGATPRRFAVNRVLRLYPAAWIAAAINGALLMMVARPFYQALGVNVVPQLGAFLRSLTLFADYHLTSAYWTLPIELAFYGLILLSLAIGGRPRLRWIARCLVFAAAPYLVALLLNTLHAIDAPWLDLGYGLKNALLVRHGPYFALGVYIWLHKVGHRLERVDVIAIALAAALAALEIFARSSELVGIYARAGGEPVGLAFLAWSACAMFAVFALAIWLSVRYNETLVPPLAGRKILRTAGLMTYPFYLLHEAVGGAVLHALGAGGAPFAARVMLALGATGVAAYLVACWGEPCVRRQLKALLEHLPAAAAAHR
jgi:peptidoglycan/LPS O-acetylase OafA/YrhL